jgi:peptide/nickel transport system permease protein
MAEFQPNEEPELDPNEKPEIQDPKKSKLQPLEEVTEKDKYKIASQRQLIWWRFRKHKAALIAGPLLFLLLLTAVFSQFISPHLPGERFSDYLNAPPQMIKFYDSEQGFSLRPFVHDYSTEINQETFQREYVVDESTRHYIHFFTQGETYKFLGLFETDIHLFGLENHNAPLFLMGTDSLGRDLFSRILHASFVSLSFAFVGVIFSLIIGVTLGAISGYRGGLTDTVIQRTIDLIMCIPTIPLWMILAAALPRDWTPIQIYGGMLLILSLVNWTDLGRVVRGKMLSLREEDFVTAARLSGTKDGRIIRKHLLPSFGSYIIVSVSNSIPAVILGETTLSFLGLGLQPPVVSWGTLLQDAQQFNTLANHPWLLLPAVFVIVAVLLFNYLGDGIRDAVDPYK